MTAPAIRVEGLWKQYRLGGGTRPSETLYDVLSATLRAPFRRRAPARDSEVSRFWALRDIGFEVAPGEVLGIIGRNGAGKSTLLKVLTRITEPTRGRIEIRGRVASLLEVGTGFHPELTGRENIYLNGAILGMSRQEISRKFDEIVAFAEVEKFLDTPVKRYSSGMYVRLAFAVAAHLEPDVLVVDEVLAVGDASFQKKCLTKMGEVRGEGRTVLFVSHNLTAVQSLCTVGLWLDQGAIRWRGEVTRAVTAYLSQGVSAESSRHWDRDQAPGNESVRLRSAAARPLGCNDQLRFDLDTPIELAFEYWNLVDRAFLNLSLHLIDEHGLIAFNTAPIREPSWHGRPFPVGLFRSSCVVPARLLNTGTYRVELLIVRDQSVVLFRDDQVLAFTVHDVPEPGLAWHGAWPGPVRPLLPWRTEFLDLLTEDPRASADPVADRVGGGVPSDAPRHLPPVTGGGLSKQ